MRKQKHIFAFIHATTICLAVFSILLASGCKSGNDGSQATEQTDSTMIAADTVAAVAEVAEPAKPLVTADMKWAWAQGNVKSIVETTKFSYSATYKETLTYNFDEKGQLIPNDAKVKRDKDGRIVNYEYKQTSIQSKKKHIKHSVTYQYNNDGNVISQEDAMTGHDFQGRTFSSAYTLGDNGLPVSGKGCSFMHSCKKEKDNYKEKYTFSNYDEHGNWTKLVRVDKHNGFTFTYTITRSITYWDEK